MRLQVVLSLVGQLLRLFSVAFIVPLLLALWDEHSVSAVRFLVSGLTCFSIGSILASRSQTPSFYRAEALAVVAFTWVFVALAAAVPYLLYGLSAEDAFFESMSGLTTTGATVLSDFSQFDRAFFLWRALTQWFGGLGVIALFVVVLPRLGIAGRQLFFAEASTAPGEAVSPQVRKGAERLWVLYSALTLLLTALLYFVSDWPLFDAFANALTTLAAGGFSPNPESIAGYNSPSGEWLITLFMVLSGTSFTLQYRFLVTRRLRTLTGDGEFLLYITAVCIIAGLLTLGLSDGVPGLAELRTGLFQTASLISSTGFASTDYNLWREPLRGLLIFAMLIGGCAGSAAGGPKVVRLLLVLKHLAREIRHTLHPRAVMAIRYKGRPVSRDIMRAVFTLTTLYTLAHLVVGGLLVLMGNDLVLGFSSALACVANVGPGFGAAGPMGNFAGFSLGAKLVLSLAMWVGRLEIVTVLALFHPDVLRVLRWKGPADSGH